MSLNLSGAPDVSVYTDSTIQARFDALVEPLQASLAQAGQSTTPTAPGKDNLDGAGLADLACAIQAFQHKHLGQDSAKAQGKSMHPPRIPAHFFLFGPTLSTVAQTSPSSKDAVYHVLYAALQFIASKGKTNWADIEGDEAVDTYIDMVASIREKLRSAGILKRFKVAASQDLMGAEAEDCKKMAEAMECECCRRSARVGTWMLTEGESLFLQASGSRIRHKRRILSSPPRRLLLRRLAPPTRNISGLWPESNCPRAAKYR